MNNEEKSVESLVENLNLIQREIIKILPSQKDTINRFKRDFSECAGKLRNLGYVAKFRKTRGKAEWTWFAVPLEEIRSGAMSRNTECGYEYTNVRPNRKTLKGDCTTRTLTYILKGEMTYDEIEREQYRLGAVFHTRRNNSRAYCQILKDRGYREISLGRKIKRSVVGNILRETITRPIATLSSHHVAVVDVGGIVRDTWDSRGGLVYKIISPIGEAYAIIDRLEEFGIPCHLQEEKLVDVGL